MSSTDAADAAGGEAIFSSDGLPPLPSPRVPKVADTGVGGSPSGQEKDVLDSGEAPLDPSEAAKIFVASRESPQERLARLQRELSEVESELKGSDAGVTKLAAQLSNHLEVGISSQDELVQLMDDHLKRQGPTEAAKGQGSVVYELYGGKIPSASSSLETRLLKLEQLVGSQADSGSGVLERIKEMEAKLERVNEKSLEDAATRAKVIR